MDSSFEQMKLTILLFSAFAKTVLIGEKRESSWEFFRALNE